MRTITLDRFAVVVTHALAIAYLALFPQTGSAQAQTAVEYHHAGWNYYFVTSFPSEVSALDGGAFGGVWKRTGETFPVWSDQVSGSSPVCRFFSTSFAPKSSHFYTPFNSECNTVKGNPDWQYEAVSFYLKTPDSNGNCPAASAPLYRLYNNGQGGAPNHRYSTSTMIANQMRAAGWVPEGFGSAGVLACVPVAAPATAEGLWFGTTSSNRHVWGIVLAEGTYYFLYSEPGNTNLAGAIQGSANFGNGAFGSSNARDFNIFPFGAVIPATVSGTYVPGVTLAGTIAEGGTTITFTTQYEANSTFPASLSAVAGTYSGRVASSAGDQPATITVTPAGGIAGNAAGCTFSGTATPRATVNIFDVTVRFNGGVCLFGTATLRGVAHYGEGVLFGMAPNGSRTDGFLFAGNK